MRDSADQDENDRSFELLNEYLEDLHAGRNTKRDTLLTKHPDLARVIDCLEAIDELAAGVWRPNSPGSTTHSDPTQVGVVDNAPRSDTPGTSVLGDFGDYELICEI